MAEVFTGRYTADVDGDFVVFLIGMRFNKLWNVRGWWPTLSAMRPMIKELRAHPELGLLHAEQAWIGGPAVVQYWRSFEHLDRYARNADKLHLPAWKKWNRASRASGAVGIWHETYKVAAGEYEVIYGNMPRLGLAHVGDHVPLQVKGRSAARRIGASAEDVPVVPYPGE
jgi:fumigallin biosynthesis monooxygenase-like protein